MPPERPCPLDDTDVSISTRRPVQRKKKSGIVKYIMRKEGMPDMSPQIEEEVIKSKDDDEEQDDDNTETTAIPFNDNDQ